jgi:hypothetical protein
LNYPEIDGLLDVHIAVEVRVQQVIDDLKAQRGLAEPLRGGVSGDTISGG